MNCLEATESRMRLSARIGERIGRRNLAVTANPYSHVLADEAELD
jgi:hypothetical protein